ncbi:serine hydrolase domain-containing protein [Nocardia fluminea]|uniref:serine hydrolase domain-containing protein n=1 Tax=Nocardia fluminea TaxID=134984 RepID=UPI00341BF8AD
MVPGRGAIAGVVLSMTILVGCSGSTDDASTATTSTAELPPNEVAGVALPAGAVDKAVGQLDELAGSLMDSSRIPGMAVAVVHGGKTVYAKGFGVREAGAPEKVDADTVFQLASVSKSLAATVVANQVGANTVEWTTPVVTHLPSFALADPATTAQLTVGDLFAHRSGLPDHAGDRLEDLGYDQAAIFDKLRLEPLDPFRITYHYTNFGLTAGAESVAAAAGKDWAQLSSDALYTPLGMRDTSSRFDDFLARPNRAAGHVNIDGDWVARYERDPDPQSPAGGASSSVHDMARWLTMLLDNGTAGATTIAPPEALLPAVTPQIVSAPPASPAARAGSYGYGFNVSTSAAGRTTNSHSGAFSLGAATNFLVIPSADVAVVVLTNAAPLGIPETLTAEFADLVQFGEVREDWRGLYREAFAAMNDPEGDLSGKPAPANPAPAQPLPAYEGSYDSAYWGPAEIVATDAGLRLTIGPEQRTYQLRHWDGDTFAFDLSGENAPPGSVTSARFDDGTLTIDYFDENGLGTFTRTD